MGDLSIYQPEDSKTVAAIYEWWRERGDSEPQRGYLGASIIGAECDRQLWYTFRQCYGKGRGDGRIYRLFNRGHREEAVFAEELRGIGCEVHTEGDTPDKQIAVSALGGHFSGHLDGVAMGIPEAPATWHLLEFKTHNAKSFAKLHREGVKVANPQHYTQMQVYMGLAKLTRALYMAVNKDTDELHAERIHYNAAEFKAIMARAKRIIEAVQAPERLTTRSDDWRCKFCEFHPFCWGTVKAAVPICGKSCRTCCHSTPKTDGEGGWHCERHKKPLAPVDVDVACEYHLLLPSLVYGADATNAGEDWVEYTNHSGETWRQGRGYWSSEELAVTPLDVLPSRTVKAARDLFDGTVTEVKPPLLERYPWEDSERVWDGPATELKAALAEHIPTALQVPTDKEENDDHLAIEYGGKYCAVLYKPEQYAAIWKGKE